MKSLNQLILMQSVLLLSYTVFAQNDTIKVTTGEVLIGEIKELNKGVLTFETDYSDSDFKIEWKEVKAVNSNRQYLITLSDGFRMNGSFKTLPDDSVKLKIIGENAEKISVVDDIVFLKPVEESFKSRLSASASLGYSLTKTQNLQQFSVRSSVGYVADRGSMSASYNTVNSSQDSLADISRNDGNLDLRYFLPKDWFLMLSLDMLQNTEQKLKLRSTTNLAIGNYFVHTNNMYMAAALGGAWNNESFTSAEEEDRNSAEGLLGIEINMFDIGDLNLLASLAAYPSITEKDRIRSDFRIDAKYDFPLDFFIKLGFTLNYDNKPVGGASKSDYVFQTTFGWEL